MLLGMDARENAEEIAVQRRGIRHARIAKQRGEYRSEGDPQHHGGGEARCGGAVEFFDKGADDERRILRLLTREDTENAGLHGQIQQGDADDRDKNPAGDVPLGIANLTAEMADVVVAPVGVDGVDRRGTEAGEKQPRESPRARRIGEDLPRMKVSRAAPDQPENRADNADPQKKRNFSNGADAAIERANKNDHQRAGDRFFAVLSQRIQIRGVLRESDGAGGKAERSLDERLPDKQEGHQAAHAARAIRLAKKNIAAAGERHGRAQFRPYKAVEQSEHGAGGPSKQALRSAHVLDNQGNDDEGSDADHLDHVERDGFFEAKSALERATWGAQLRVQLTRVGVLGRVHCAAENSKWTAA